MVTRWIATGVHQRSGRVSSTIWLKSFPDGWERPLVTADNLARSWVSSFGDLSFSPDGQRLAFSVSRSGGHSVYVFNSAGGPLIKLTPGFDDERAPAWSPGEETIAFAANIKGAWWLATASSSGGAPNLLRRVPSIRDLRWSPRGDSIACNTRDALLLLSADGSQVRATLRGDWLTFDWSKDGSHLLGIVRSHSGKRTVVKVEAAAGHAIELGDLDLPPAAEIGRMSVAADGESVAVAVSKPRGDIWLLQGFPGRRPLLESSKRPGAFRVAPSAVYPRSHSQIRSSSRRTRAAAPSCTVQRIRDDRRY